jgi:hypothetical protein
VVLVRFEVHMVSIKMSVVGDVPLKFRSISTRLHGAASQKTIIFMWSLMLCRSRGSSVSIVSDCGLDNRVIEVRSPTEAKDFSSNLCVQTSSEAHPASCTMGAGGPFPGAKRGRGVTLTTHPI